MNRKRRGPLKATKAGAGGPGSGDPPAGKLYSAGEVVRIAGISRQVLHSYTVLGLLHPAERTATNRRYYAEPVFRRIRLIRRMLESGYTLQSLREIFPWED